MATNDGSITGRGTRWEFLHSIWILWTFTLSFFGWVAFFYVGIRAKEPRWVAWGAFYSVPFILAMIFTDQEPMFSVAAALTLLLGVMGIVHAFRIRPDYLERLAARQRGRAPAEAFYPPDARRHEQPAQPVSPAEPTPTAPPAPAMAPRQAASSASNAAVALELNAATERELASLPGVGPVLAKRAVTERAQRGGFGSVDELGQILDLKPHVIERLRPLLAVGAQSRPSRAGRTGRLIDF